MRKKKNQKKKFKTIKYNFKKLKKVLQIIIKKIFIKINNNWN